MLRTLSIFLVAFLISISGNSQPKDTMSLLQMNAPEYYKARLQTSAGVIEIEVQKKWAPLAAKRFYQLVKSGFYNNSRMFRSNKKYLQFGIADDSAVNAFWDRRPFADEPVLLKNDSANISFATAGPNTRTTSVYFNKVNNPKLDTIRNGMAFPAFGKITMGFEVLAHVENIYVDSIVFAHWDSMTVKGNSFTDSVLPGLVILESIKIIEEKVTGHKKMPARKPSSKPSKNKHL
jgi:peptidyl-prolyl cis-trans isomerase A (cyclophilin A)